MGEYKDCNILEQRKVFGRRRVALSMDGKKLFELRNT
jgi:hypothetical protein